MSTLNSPFMQFTPVDPTQSFSKGYGIGQTFQANQQAADAKVAAQQQAAQYRQLYETAMAEGSTKADWDALMLNTPPADVPAMQAVYDRRTASMEADLEGAQNAAYQEAYNNCMKSGWTSESVQELLAVTPKDQLDNVKLVMETMSTEEKEAVTKETMQVLSLFRMDEANMIAETFATWAAAARADGDEEQAKIYEKQAETAASGPDGMDIVEGNLMAGLVMSGAVGSDSFDALMKMQGEARADRIANFDETRVKLEVSAEERAGDEFTADQAQTVVENELAQENLKIAQENHARLMYNTAANNPFKSEADRDRAMAVAESHGDKVGQYIVELSSTVSSLDGMSSKDIVDAYLPIEKEYNDLVEDVDIVILNAKNIENMLQLEGGAASQAMITLFNKVLDPGSVVRQSEYANTAQAAGAVNTLTTAWERLQNGVVLGPEAQQRVVEAAALMANIAEREKIKIQEDIGSLIDEAGLKRDVIFKTAGTLEENEHSRNQMLLTFSLPESEADLIANSTPEELAYNYGPQLEDIRGKENALSDEAEEL